MIIIDLHIPGLCGIDLINHIRKTHTRIKVIVFTTFVKSDLEDQKKYKRANMI